MRAPAVFFTRPTDPARDRPLSKQPSRRPYSRDHTYRQDSWNPAIWPSIEALENQVFETQPRRTRPEPCRKCGAKFASKNALFRHIYANCCGQRFRCRLCHETFPSRNTLFRHLRQPERCVQCCEEPFKTPTYESDAESFDTSEGSDTSESNPSENPADSPVAEKPMRECSPPPFLQKLYTAAKANTATEAIASAAQALVKAFTPYEIPFHEKVYRGMHQTPPPRNWKLVIDAREARAREAQARREAQAQAEAQVASVHIVGSTITTSGSQISSWPAQPSWPTQPSRENQPSWGTQQPSWEAQPCWQTPSWPARPSYEEQPYWQQPSWEAQPSWQTPSWPARPSYGEQPSWQPESTYRSWNPPSLQPRALHPYYDCPFDPDRDPFAWDNWKKDMEAQGAIFDGDIADCIDSDESDKGNDSEDPEEEEYRDEYGPDESNDETVSLGPWPDDYPDGPYDGNGQYGEFNDMDGGTYDSYDSDESYGY